VRRQVRGKEVKDDIKGPVRVQVKITDETDDAFPYRLHALRENRRGLQWKASGG